MHRRNGRTTRELLVLVLALGTLIGALLAGGFRGAGNAGSAAGEAAGGPFAAGCPGSEAPLSARGTRAAVSHLAAHIRALLPAGGAREYASGLIQTSNLWSNNAPQPLEHQRHGRLLPRAVEVRWWVPAGEGRRDDVVVDVVAMRSVTGAKRLLARAASPRCRRQAIAFRPRTPSGALGLGWVNPDGAVEWDSLLRSGRLVYRFVVVAPSGAPADQALRYRTIQLRARSALLQLACRIPGADCRAQQDSPAAVVA